MWENKVRRPSRECFQHTGCGHELEVVSYRRVVDECVCDHDVGVVIALSIRRSKTIAGLSTKLTPETRCCNGRRDAERKRMTALEVVELWSGRRTELIAVMRSRLPSIWGKLCQPRQNGPQSRARTSRPLEPGNWGKSAREVALAYRLFYCYYSQVQKEHVTP